VHDYLSETMNDTTQTTESQGQAQAHKTRIVTLTGRPPVRIVEAEWPVIAQGDGDSYGDGDGARHSQAVHRGEVDEYTMRVRQHADGRTLVYGALSAAAAAWGAGAEGEDWRGGRLLGPGADIASAIRTVGEEGHIPDHIIRECIAGLPAEDL